MFVLNVVLSEDWTPLDGMDEESIKTAQTKLKPDDLSKKLEI
jgi:hypothetical protein